MGFLEHPFLFPCPKKMMNFHFMQNQNLTASSYHTKTWWQTRSPVISAQVVATIIHLDYVAALHSWWEIELEFNKVGGKIYLYFGPPPPKKKEEIFRSMKKEILIWSISRSPLGRGSNNQNGNLRWYLPWRGGGLEGVSSATYLFWKMIFFKTI